MADDGDNCAAPEHDALQATRDAAWKEIEGIRAEIEGSPGWFLRGDLASLARSQRIFAGNTSELHGLLRRSASPDVWLSAWDREHPERLEQLLDEADRLCDRIAIVDHGKLVALDSPRALKNSVPGSSVIEAQFLNAPSDWEQRLKALNGVTSIQPEAANMYRILTQDGSHTTTELVETAVHSGVVLKSLTVQSTTLDDVFVHYTGRQLRDQIVDAPMYKSPVNWE